MRRKRVLDGKGRGLREGVVRVSEMSEAGAGRG